VIQQRVLSTTTRDYLTDRHCKEVSAIMVYRINNFDEEKASSVLEKIKKEKKWFMRRFER